MKPGITLIIIGIIILTLSTFRVKYLRGLLFSKNVGINVQSIDKSLNNEIIMKFISVSFILFGIILYAMNSS